LPGRKSLDANGLTQFIRKTIGVIYSGFPGKQVSLLTNDPNDKENQFADPYWIFYIACKHAKKAGKFGDTGFKWDAEWNKLIGEDAGKDRVIKVPTGMAFLQGHVLQAGKNNYVTDRDGVPLGLKHDDPLPVVRVSKAACEAVFRLAAMLKDGMDVASQMTDFKYPDLIGRVGPDGSIKGGLFLVFFNPATHSQYKEYSSWDGTYPDNGFSPGYEVAVRTSLSMPTKKGPVKLSSSMSADDVAMAASKVQFWTDNPDYPDDPNERGLLRFMPHEERCEKIARAFSDVPQLLEFAWADHPEFMTDAVRGILRARVSAVVPGAEESTTEAYAEPESLVPSADTEEMNFSEESDEFAQDGTEQVEETVETEEKAETYENAEVAEEVADEFAQTEEEAEPFEETPNFSDEGETSEEVAEELAAEDQASDEEPPAEGDLELVDQADAGDTGEVEFQDGGQDEVDQTMASYIDLDEDATARQEQNRTQLRNAAGRAAQAAQSRSSKPTGAPTPPKPAPAKPAPAKPAPAKPAPAKPAPAKPAPAKPAPAKPAPAKPGAAKPGAAKPAPAKPAPAKPAPAKPAPAKPGAAKPAPGKKK
jgi:hypothetical protein